MMDNGQLVEIQGTGENGSFSEEQLFQMLNLAKVAIADIIELQKAAVKI